MAHKVIYRLSGLVQGIILERVNRFTISAIIENVKTYAHLTNTGKLNDVLVYGRTSLFKRIKGRKLEFRLIGVEDHGFYNIVDTITQNKIFERLIEKRRINKLSGCIILKRNPRVGSEVFDYILRCGDGEILVETKSAVLRSNEAAMYPDCPSLRGRRQVSKLIELTKEGVRTLLVFISALPHVKCFKPYYDGDPILYELIGKAYLNGVDIMALSMYMDLNGYIYIDDICLPLCKDWIDNISSI